MEFLKSKWRLLVTPAAHGAWNMAVDEAILEAVGSGDALPTLRLYAWQPPCLSLGYAQPFSDMDTVAIKARGWDAVRRLTGGRAILHADELTYSVAGPPDEPRLAGGVLASYRVISAAWLVALKKMGIQAQVAPKVIKENPGEASESERSPITEKNPVCFEAPSDYEIVVGGKKLVGSAQARRKDGVLQHGTLPLSGDLSRVVLVLNFADETQRSAAACRLLARATTVQEVLGAAPEWEHVGSVVADAFAQALNLDLLPEWLSKEEQARARELVEGKYSSQTWTARL